MVSDKRKILITCGPTWVALDSVRVISNKSTGELGHILAEDFTKKGAKVTLLEGPVLEPFKSKAVKVIKFFYFDELQAALKKELKKSKFDVVVHAAAVADYTPKSKSRGKISSQKSGLDLKLVPTKKIINELKRWSPKSTLVGFKLDPELTAVNAAKKVNRLFKDADCDIVVANRVQGASYHGYILNNKNKIVAQADSRAALSKKLMQIL